ncbi:hypothetical protein ACFE04_016725 [Oxalis oulophora]
MSISLPTLLLSPNLSLKTHLRHTQSFTFRSTTIHSFNNTIKNPPFIKNPQFLKLGFVIKAESSSSSNSSKDVEFDEDESERLARGESTMPDRFKYLSKEAPNPPLRWPWFLEYSKKGLGNDVVLSVSANFVFYTLMVSTYALGFLIYAWRAVLFELSNWKRAVFVIVGFVGYLLKFALALIYHFIGEPITSLLACVETAIYSVRALYSSIINYTPIRELSVIIILSSVILAIAEAVVPDAVSSQPLTLTLSGLIGYAAVRGYVSEPFFWTLLFGIYAFSKLIKKKDDVSAALPVAAVLAAVGEPWVRVITVVSYLALAILKYSKGGSEGKDDVEPLVKERRVPVPLLCAGLAIGIRVAAKWAGYRHLTWMIV